MSQRLIIHHDVTNPQVAETLIRLCPFSAFEWQDEQLVINSNCRLCGICVRKGPEGVITWRRDQKEIPDLSVDQATSGQWQGVAVLADTMEGYLHPVTFELIGKARQLAKQLGQQVYVLMAGYQLQHQIRQIEQIAPDRLHVYDDPLFRHFQIDTYAEAAAAFIQSVKPAAMLIGATQAGRMLAPGIAARFRTGLTADCTALEISREGGLVQIRPAFGGNIMARILTRKNRPQLCTVRYKVFPAPVFAQEGSGTCQVIQEVLPKVLADQQQRARHIRCQVLSVKEKPKGIDLTEAEAIIAVGRGLRSRKDLDMIQQLADLLKAEMACTRPLIENGWFDPRRQIGLSGRTVSPDLLITIGVSGSVQFIAGMRGAKSIMTVNTDPEAPICGLAHHVFAGDLYEIIPSLISQIRKTYHITQGGPETCQIPRHPEALPLQKT